MTVHRLILGDRDWVNPIQGFACARGSHGCQPIADYEGECIDHHCDGTQAQVIYAPHQRPENLEDYQGPEILKFACKTCRLIQDPEPSEPIHQQQTLI